MWKRAKQSSWEIDVCAVALNPTCALAFSAEQLRKGSEIKATKNMGRRSDAWWAREAKSLWTDGTREGEPDYSKACSF